MEYQQKNHIRQSDNKKRVALPIAQSLFPSHISKYPFLQFQQAIGNRAFGQLIQAKLRIGQAGDVYEQEADRVAEQVMTMPDPEIVNKTKISGQTQRPQIQRLCPECDDELRRQPEEEEEEEPIQTKEVLNARTAVIPAIAKQIKSLRGGGQQLPYSVRSFFEPRFGYDFSQIRVHTSTEGADSARKLNALAYTAGRDVVFGAWQYEPRTSVGLRLIAHELTHVVQQGTVGESSRLPMVQREGIDEELPPIPDPRDPAISSAPKGKAWKGASAKCGPNFCRPLPTQRMAEDERKTLWPIFMAGIFAKVSPRVIPLWTEWAFGGSSVKNLNKDFGKDFTASPTTARTTKFLVGELKTKLKVSPPNVPSGSSTKLDIPTLIPAAVKAIDTPGHAKQMNFNAIGDIPGNIAGGIGKNQAANLVGAKPSPQNDERIAKGEVTVTDGGAGKLTVTPNLSYTVKDTIDLCPGDCGASKERIATIPMSRWEATGISGDVPYTVDFPAVTSSFTISKPAMLPPVPKKP